ncbi:MAG: hypothetical protein ABI165_00120, partial [Bryobacteraceae bacterium]
MRRPGILFLILILALAATVVGADLHSGWWRGRRVTYNVVNGRAMWQGDIILGGAEDVAKTPPPMEAKNHARKFGVFYADPSFLWPGGVVPYTIDASITPAQLKFINTAIAVYTNNTPVQWTPRTNQADYVRFAG